jgi:hypothetical protein
VGAGNPGRFAPTTWWAMQVRTSEPFTDRRKPQHSICADQFQRTGNAVVNLTALKKVGAGTVEHSSITRVNGVAPRSSRKAQEDAEPSDSIRSTADD